MVVHAVFEAMLAGAEALTTRLLNHRVAAMGGFESDDAAQYWCFQLVAQHRLGTGLYNVLYLGLSLIMLGVLWPYDGAGAKPVLWDHLQRFSWTQGHLPSDRAARDAETGHMPAVSAVRSWGLACVWLHRAQRCSRGVSCPLLMRGLYEACARRSAANRGGSPWRCILRRPFSVAH